ncbi:hypothetical protein BDV35DRAFT_349656 [Aspergillus flavus]|uniref:Uncharacterized protein n=1 Tax=Aspergillus flavus TaxID=5059 RepID=A0A5N6H2W1_ASPFL|nr:hypothetical protein BDV35DRAFT_349656 [Aspergillus flavus]
MTRIVCIDLHQVGINILWLKLVAIYTVAVLLGDMDDGGENELIWGYNRCLHP